MDPKKWTMWDVVKYHVYKSPDVAAILFIMFGVLVVLPIALIISDMVSK